MDNDDKKTSGKKWITDGMKKYANNGFWGAIGATLGILYSDSRRKDEILRRRRRTFLGGASLLAGTVMMFTTGIKSCDRIVEQYFNNSKAIELQRIDLEKEKVKRGYDGSIKKMKDEVSYLKLENDNLKKTIDTKVENLDTKVGNLGGDIAYLKNNQTNIGEKLSNVENYTKTIANNTQEIEKYAVNASYDQKNLEKTVENSIKKNLERNIEKDVYVEKKQGRNNSNYDLSHETTSAHKSESYLLVADKSEQRLTLFTDDGKRLHDSRMIYSRYGGPDNGIYNVRSVQSRSGELYPGVAKLTDIIVITGSGEDSQYDRYIDRNMNVTKTGIRIHNDDYNTIASKIDGKNTRVYVRD